MTDVVRLPARHVWPVTLRWGALVLRPMARADQAAWQAVRQRNRAWLSQWDATSPTGARPVGFREVVARQRKGAKEGYSVPWVLGWDEGWPVDPAPDRHAKLIGQVTIANIVYGAGQFASIGYWIDEQYAGRGLMPTAVALATDYAWRVIGLHRIEIGMRPENAKSRSVVTKLGFRYEGVRPRFLHIDGAWRDHDIYALNAEEVPEGLLARWRRTHPSAPGTH